MEQVATLKAAHNVRTIWISDVHLGFPACSAEYLDSFLRAYHCETLYLVGDIIDFWYMKNRRYWPESHTDVVRCILDKAGQDCDVVYIPGNHDEPLQHHAALQLGNIRVEREVIHHALDGRRYLVLHGDQYDDVIRFSPWLAVIGNHLYDVLLRLNRYVNWFRRKLKKDYWSLAAFLKHKVKNAVQYISRFEQTLVDAARERNVDGLICGHIHHAEIRQLDTSLYLNCGDWVESCTALVEHWDGRIELIHWSGRREVLKTLAPRTTQATPRETHQDVAA